MILVYLRRFSYWLIKSFSLENILVQTYSYIKTYSYTLLDQTHSYREYGYKYQNKTHQHTKSYLPNPKIFVSENFNFV